MHVDDFDYALPPGGVVLEQLEKDLVRQALARCNGNQTRAAKLLGLSRQSLYAKLSRYDITDSQDEG